MLSRTAERIRNSLYSGKKISLRHSQIAKIALELKAGQKSCDLPALSPKHRNISLQTRVVLNQQAERLLRPLERLVHNYNHKSMAMADQQSKDTQQGDTDNYQKPSLANPSAIPFDRDCCVYVTGLASVGNALLKRELEREGVPVRDVRKTAKSDGAVIALSSPHSRVHCVSVLRSKSFRSGKPLIWPQVPEEVMQNPFIDPISLGPQPSPAADDIRHSVTPMWDVPYDQQLEAKAAALRHSLSKVSRAFLKKQLPDIGQKRPHHVSIKKVEYGENPEWLQGKGVRDPCCPLETMHASPITSEYRNKCDFTIGMDAQGKAACGFLLGRTEHGRAMVSTVEQCINVPLSARSITAAVTAKLREGECGPVYETSGPDKDAKGVWRKLMVRESREGGRMIVLQGHGGMAGSEETFHIWANSIAKCIDNACKQHEPPLSISGIILQDWRGASNAASEDTPITILDGSSTFVDRLGNVKYHVSHSAFFQVNGPSFDVLLRELCSWADVTKDCVLLDVCCGTGALGLALADQVHKVIGVDIVESAIEDARKNALLNGIKNAEFVAGRAEKVLPTLVENEKKNGRRVVAITDPPREGLHTKVITTLRNCAQLDSIVAVACNHVTFIENCVDLCRPQHPKAPNTKPFNPVKAAGFDLFPHTPHVELMTLLKR